MSALAVYPVRHTARSTIVARCKFLFGASGAVVASGSATTASKVPDPAFTLTKSATGVYTVTMPPGVEVDIQMGIYSPLRTVWSVVVTALDSAAGTATISFSGGTTDVAATEPASGDYVVMRFFARTEE
jgi:hypothetical protein